MSILDQRTVDEPHLPAGRHPQPELKVFGHATFLAEKPGLEQALGRGHDRRCHNEIVQEQSVEDHPAAGLREGPTSLMNGLRLTEGHQVGVCQTHIRVAVEERDLGFQTFREHDIVGIKKGAVAPAGLANTVAAGGGRTGVGLPDDRQVEGTGKTFRFADG